jgi:hypothetical protein
LIPIRRIDPPTKFVVKWPELPLKQSDEELGFAFLAAFLALLLGPLFHAFC